MRECIVCNNNHAHALYPSIVQCPTCGHVYADIELSADQIAKIYRQNYFIGEEYSNYIEDKNVLQKNFRMRFEVLKTFTDSLKNKRLIEIGSAYGFFLEVVKDYFDYIIGYDIAKSGVDYTVNKLNLNARHADFLEAKMCNDHFDVACLWDCIEHLQHPNLYVEKLSRHMEKGSYIALTTGDICSLNARIRKQKWRLIHPPTHLHYFSKTTLKRMLEQYGYEIMYSRHCGFYRSIKGIIHNINIFVMKTNHSFLNKFMNSTILNNKYLYMNQFDIIYIIAQKKR